MSTPREVMFEEIYVQWAVSNKSLARAIVLHDSVTSGKSPLELIEVRSSLSRFVVHVDPGENVYGWIAPFDQVIPRVMALIKSSRKQHDSDYVRNVLTGECARKMRISLDEWGSDGALFANVMERIRGGEVVGAADAAETALALFVVAGCVGDAREAARYAIDMMDRLALTSELRTRYSSDDEFLTHAGATSRFGLYRLSEGKLSGVPHALSESRDGTEIGSMSLAEHSINDVGPGVSRRHARVWRDEAGSWWVEDLDSTNGTVVLRANGERIVIGSPHSQRGDRATGGRVSIEPGDHIVLAGRTEFSFVELV